MPTLSKSKRNYRIYKKHDLSAEISKIYNTPQWRKLRLAHLMQHPLCEQCLIEGKTKLAEEIHHIRPISSGIAFDPYNLMSLCVEHHHEIHKNMRNNR